MAIITRNDMSSILDKLKAVFLQIKDAVKTVNGQTPDEYGDVSIEKVDFATDLESSSTQYSEGTYTDRTSGGEASIQDGDAWLVNIRGNAIHSGKVDEVLSLEVISEEENPITAEINEETFKAAVTQNAVITLTFATTWDTDPATYGVTVTGSPVDGDKIVITYVKEVLGTISVSNPTRFASTGWNLYNHNGGNGYARVKKYNQQYGFRIEGTYTGITFAETFDGERQAVTVTNGNFNVPSDGYVFITGGNSSDTAVFMTWSDWTEGYMWDGTEEGEFSAYSETVIDLSSLFGTDHPFPYGLLAVGTVRDEINLNIGQAISRVERLENTAENLATAQSSGREYDYDDNYIYLARASAVTTSISISGAYTVDDHGMEIFTTDVPVIAQSIYGASLKNKLERDVLTISQQTLSAAQKGQARANIGAITNDDVLCAWGTRQTIKEIKNGNTTVAYLYGRINSKAKLGWIYLVGNANTPQSASTTISVTLPAAFVPVYSSLTPLKDGKYMEIRTDGKANIVFSGTPYAGASIVYPLG